MKGRKSPQFSAKFTPVTEDTIEYRRSVFSCAGHSNKKEDTGSRSFIDTMIQQTRQHFKRVFFVIL